MKLAALIGSSPFTFCIEAGISRRSRRRGSYRVLRRTSSPSAPAPQGHGEILAIEGDSARSACRAADR